MGDGLVVSVDPDSGEASFAEIDLVSGDVVLARMRTSGRCGRGVFGAGWGSDLDARVVRGPGGGAFVARPQGLVAFVPLPEAGSSTLISVTGEVELLRQTDAGFTLHAADGRSLDFDREGRVARVGLVAVERAPGRTSLVGTEGRIDLDLDGAGSVVRARAGDLVVTYCRRGGELVEVGGAHVRRYGLEAGRIARVEGALGDVLAAEYGFEGRLARLVRADGWTQTYTFSTAPGNVPEATVTTPHGRWSYRLEDEQDGGSAWRINTPAGDELVRFDVRGRIVARQRAGGSLEPVAVRDVPPASPALLSTPAVDDLGVSAVADIGSGTALVRDRADRLVEATTPAGRRWTFGWEGQRLVRAHGPMGTVEDQHDAAGRVVHRADATRGWSLRYDASGRPVEVSAETTDDALAFAWGASGQLIGAATPQASLSLERDADGAVLSARTGWAEGSVDLLYEGDATRESVDAPWGVWTTTFDGSGRPETLSSPAGVLRVRHDARSGQVSGLTYPGGLTVQFERDAAGRVARRTASRAGKPILNLEVVRDALGERIAVRRDGRTTRLLLDEAARLVGLERDGRVVACWSYDADGNRLGAGERLDLEGRLVVRGSERMEHDRAGRLLARHHTSGVDRYLWDGLGRLAGVERTGKPPVTYGYDGLGRLALRREGQAETRYVWDGERLLAEVGPGERLRLWAHGPGTDEPIAFWDGRQGEVPAARGWTWLLLDERHDGVAYFDAAGRVVDQAALDPWGCVERAPAAGRPIVFAGRLVDPATGLVHLRARWYAPEFGRFLSADPAGLAGGPSPWAYASGRPHALVDPLGLAPEEPEAPGLFARAWGGVTSGLASAADTVVGATQGAAYLLPFTGYGTDEEKAAARAASIRDVTSGRAASRALGAMDGYAQGLSLGLVDPNLRSHAFDQAEAERGQGYGQAGSVVFSVISGRQAIAGLGRAAWGGARAVPGLVKAAPGALRSAARALPGALEAAPGAARALAGRAGSALVAAGGAARDGIRALPRLITEAPGAARDAARWLLANAPGAGRAAGRFALEQGRNAWNVTGRPFVSATEFASRPARALLARLRGATPALRAADAAADGVRAAEAAQSAVGAATLLDDAGRAGSALADDAARGSGLADDVAQGGAAVEEVRAPQDGLAQLLDPDMARGTGSTPRPASRPNAPRPPPEFGANPAPTAAGLPNDLAEISKRLARDADKAPAILGQDALLRLGKDSLTARTDCGLCSLAGYEQLAGSTSGRTLTQLRKAVRDLRRARGDLKNHTGDGINYLDVNAALESVTGRAAKILPNTTGKLAPNALSQLVASGALKNGDPLIVGITNGQNMGHYVLGRIRDGALELFDLQQGTRIDPASIGQMFVHYVPR